MRTVAGLICLLALCSVVHAQTPDAEMARADSLFTISDWAGAEAIYDKLMRLDANKTNALEWNRLGYCRHHLGKYQLAITHYLSALQNNRSPVLRQIVQARMARVYCVLNQKDKAIEWLDKAVASGYSNLKELETEKDFANIRSDARFKQALQKATERAYPCMADPRSRQFDFWVGQWNVHDTRSGIGAGQSVIQSVSGGCMILENWSSLQNAFNGKSINYVDTATGKWVQVWVGSDGSGAQTFLNGEYRDSAMRFTFSGIDPGNKPYTGRFIFYNQGPNQVRQYQDKSYDNGVTWQVQYDLTYVRKQD